MQSTDLGIAIYLNQQVVFDLLAVLDDGFSQLATIKTSSSDSESSKSGVGGSIGASNVFALLGITFSGEKGKEQGSQEFTELNQQKVHTPTSLFAKLRLKLQELNLVHQIDNDEIIPEINTGDFVEFKAVLRKNPIVETIEGFKQLMEIAVMFQEDAKNPQSSTKKRDQQQSRKQTNPNTVIIKQMDGILSALNQSDSLELIGELVDTEQVMSVLTTRPDFFSHGGATEIIDGEFHVLGKVIRVAKSSSDESINLLRKTAFGKFDQGLFDQFSLALAGLEEAGMRPGELVTEIGAPAMLIIPIAIFT
ncbi:MAG: hypothetical protein R3C62_11970 [Chloroflexota bacterium]